MFNCFKSKSKEKKKEVKKLKNYQGNLVKL